MLIWLNGEWCEAESATLSPLAAGTLLGWGVFTTLGVWRGRAFLLDRHLRRLRAHAAQLEIGIVYDDDTLISALQHILQRNAIRDGMARITVTQRGDGRWHRAEGSDISIVALPQSTFSDEARLWLSPYRFDARRPLAGVKSTSYGDYLMAWRAAHARGCDDAIVCDAHGHLSECARANLFWARDGTLFTPSRETGCLAGIAREIVLEWARESGISVCEGFFAASELRGAGEVFITSAATGPRAVREINGEHERGAYEIGPLTKRLQQRWQEATQREARV